MYNVYYVLFQDIDIDLFYINILSKFPKIDYLVDFEDKSVVRRSHMRRQGPA